MDFFIKKNATLPILKLAVIKDGRSDYNEFMDLIETSALFFSMVDIETGVPKISTRPAGFVEKVNLDPNAEVEYYIYYQFTNRDTNRVGRYEGQFLLRTDSGNLILPIQEKLFINIQDSFISDELPYESCYVSEFPCCVSGPSNTTTTTTACPPCPTCPEPTPTPITTTTTTSPTPVTTTTTTIMSGSTAWKISVGVAEAAYFCDRDIMPYTIVYTSAMDTLTPGVRLYSFPELIGDPIELNHQVFYFVYERDGIPLDNLFSFNPEGGSSYEMGPRYVANVYTCGDQIPCRELTFTRNSNQTSVLMSYNCSGSYTIQPISLGQTITLCGSYPVYMDGLSITIGNNC